MKKQLRFAVEQDAPELLEIYRPYVETTSITFETEVPTVEEFTERIRDTLTKFPYLVIEEDGKILGYAYAHPFHTRAAYGWTVESSVYVRQDVRHGHIGTLLYEALMERLSNQGSAMSARWLRCPMSPAWRSISGWALPPRGFCQTSAIKWTSGTGWNISTAG